MFRPLAFAHFSFINTSLYFFKLVIYLISSDSNRRKLRVLLHVIYLRKSLNLDCDCVLVINKVGPQERTLFFMAQSKIVIILGDFNLIRSSIFDIKRMSNLFIIDVFEIELIGIVALVQINSDELDLTCRTALRFKF